MTPASSRTPLLAADLQTRDEHRLYVGCTRRPCAYTAAYEPLLEQLRNRIARLEAELEFTCMQIKRGEV
jgi:hypothetical protein